MKKIIFIVGNIIITFVIATVSIYTYNKFFQEKKVQAIQENSNTKFNGLEKDLVNMEKDLSFYKNLGNYKYLLNKDDLITFEQRASDFEKNKDNEDLFIIFYSHFMIKQQGIGGILDKLKNEIELRKIKYTKTEEDDLFNKNNACINLSKSLEDKLQKEEKLNVIFYSPITKSCLYVVTNKYRHLGTEYDGYKSYGYDTLKIYNSINQAELENYLVAYSYDYPNKNKDDVEKETNLNKGEFVKYILENSNFNPELLKDISFSYLY